VQRSWTRFGLCIATLSVVCLSARAASNASVTGVVRDARGAAQIGAMVQVLAGGPNAVATVFTDFYGRYRVANLPAGSYRVRATAAMFLPATRGNLRLVTGTRAIVNLTLNMIADPAVWLPAERRLPGEPGDDWAWTLRSAPDRPILRVLSGGSLPGGASGTQSETRRQSPKVRMRAAMAGNDGGFGDGLMHSVIALDRVAASGSDIVLQADLGTPIGALAGNQPSGEVSAGYQRKDALGGTSRMVLSYASHPELQTSGASGMQWMRMASAQKMQLGDLAEVEAGGTVYAIHANGYALSTRPFLRVTVHPGQVWAVRYRLATSRDVQAFDSLDSPTGDAPVAARKGGRLITENGMHQEIAVTRKAGSGAVRVMVYRDNISQPAISGTGAASPGDMPDGGVVDGATGSFRMIGTGYSADGVSVALAEPIGPAVWGSVEYTSGAGLATRGDNQSLVAAAFHPMRANSATAALNSKIARTHTSMSASYRWQPHGVVTPVAAYSAADDQAYLSFYVRQAISLGNLLPQGLEATVDVTNLLAEGYHPFLSADGRTLYLAQAPRTVRAGLAFNF
jgi:hypothetical protein